MGIEEDANPSSLVWLFDRALPYFPLEGPEHEEEAGRIPYALRSAARRLVGKDPEERIYISEEDYEAMVVGPLMLRDATATAIDSAPDRKLRWINDDTPRMVHVGYTKDSADLIFRFEGNEEMLRKLAKGKASFSHDFHTNLFLTDAQPQVGGKRADFRLSYVEDEKYFQASLIYNPHFDLEAVRFMRGRLVEIEKIASKDDRLHA